MRYIIIDPSEKPRIDTLRSKAKRHGLRLIKSRERLHWNNRGGFRLMDADRNAVLCGADFDLDLEAAEHWVNHHIRARANAPRDR